MVAGEGRGHATRADVVVTVDLRAFRRGHTHDGEQCSIVGAGPIPVELARTLAEDGFLKAVLHDGVAIHTVAHFGRHLPAELRTALELGAPPTSTGSSASKRAAGGATGSSGTTSTPSPTTDRPASPTSDRGAGPITGRRPSSTASPGSSTDASAPPDAETGPP